MISPFVLLFFPLRYGTVIRNVRPDLRVGKCPIVKLKALSILVLFLLCEVQRPFV